MNRLSDRKPTTQDGPTFGAWRGALALLAIPLGAVCYWLAFPLAEIAACGWLAFLVWLWALWRAPTGFRACGMFAAGFATAALGLTWLWKIFPVFCTILWAIFAAYFLVWGALLGLSRRWPTWARVLWPAVAWTALEYVKGERNPLCFSWLSLGYSQINLVGATLASWVGVYGVSFAMVLWGAVVVWLLAEANRHAPRTVALLCALGVVPVLAWVPIRRWEGPTSGVARLQQFDESGEIVAGYDDASGVDLIVWPEYTFFEDLGDKGSNGHRLVRRIAAKADWGMIVGGIGQAPGERDYTDTAFFLDANGDLLGWAAKNQPIQLMRDGLPAADVAVIECPMGGVDIVDEADGKVLRFGVGVCYDGSFQRFARRMVSRGADVLVFPVMNHNDWGAVQHRQHQRMFQVRAAECRRGVLVAAFSGPTFAAMPNGFVAGVAPFGRTTHRDEPVPRGTGRTFFLRAGWLIGPLCALLVVAALVATAGAACFRPSAPPRGAAGNPKSQSFTMRSTNVAPFSFDTGRHDH